MPHVVQHLALSLALTLAVVACAGDDSIFSMADAGAPMDVADAEPQCAMSELTGMYGVTLVMRAGNCGEQTEPATLSFPESQSGFLTNLEMRAGTDLTTTTVIKGCSLRLTYEVLREGLLTSTLSAGDLELVSEGLLEGQAQLTLYTTSTPQMVACQGTYDMTMRAQP